MTAPMPYTQLTVVMIDPLRFSNTPWVRAISTSSYTVPTVPAMANK